MDRKNTVCYHLKACWHTIARMYNSHGLEQDISISMGYVLLNLSPKKGTPSTHIAPMLGMEPRSLTRLLKSMEEKKLIKKETDQHDKRQVNIYLTGQGAKKKGIARETVKDFNDLLKSKIRPSDLDIFNAVLEQITTITEQNFKAI